MNERLCTETYSSSLRLWVKTVLINEPRRWGGRELTRSSSGSSIWWETSHIYTVYIIHTHAKFPSMENDIDTFSMSRRQRMRTTFWKPRSSPRPPPHKPGGTFLNILHLGDLETKTMFRSFSPERESSSSLHQLEGYQSAGSTGFSFFLLEQNLFYIYH